MCKRSDNDPLVRVLTDRYKLNILRLPRGGIGVGELLIRDKGDLICAGSIAGFFTPELKVPPPAESALPDVDEVTSSRRSVGVAAKPLVGLLTALGAVGLTSAEASLRDAHDVRVAFKLTGTQYHSTPLKTLGDELSGRVLPTGNALYQPGREFFVAHAAADATGMRVAYSAGSDRTAKLMLDLAATIKAEASVDAARDRSGHFVISGPKRFTFGLAVVRLVMVGGSIRFETSGPLHPVRGKGEPVPGPAAPAPYFFGGDDGDALVEVG